MPLWQMALLRRDRHWTPRPIEWCGVMSPVGTYRTSRDVCYWVKSGRQILRSSFSAFDPEQTFPKRSCVLGTYLRMRCVHGLFVVRMQVHSAQFRFKLTQECAGERGQAMELVRFFFSFSGQVNRAKYWIGVGIVFAVSLLALLFWSALPIMGVQVALVWLVICGVAFLALAAKRLHDLGKSGWGVLGFAILWVLIWASGFDLGSLAAVAFGIGIIWLGSAQGVMELGYVRTDFGPGTIARSFYLLSSALCFGLLMMITRPPRDLEITTTMHVFTLVFMFLILTASGFAGRALSRRHRQDAQHKRDMRAQKLLEAAQIKKVPDFSLFLRAFETTGRMPRQEELPLSPGFDPRMDEDRTADFERVLAEAVENGLPLVALGAPGEQIGAGSII